MTAPENLAKANAALPSLGFVALTKQIWDKSDSNQEYKWGRSDNPNILIELHGNLVHYASFRRLLSYSYTDLLRAGDGDPNAPAALLMTAIVHAACGHKFHRLQFAVDIVQAARALPDADIPLLERGAREIGAELELAVSLNLAGQIFGGSAHARPCTAVLSWLYHQAIEAAHFSGRYPQRHEHVRGCLAHSAQGVPRPAAPVASRRRTALGRCLARSFKYRRSNRMRVGPDGYFEGLHRRGEAGETREPAAVRGQQTGLAGPHIVRGKRHQRIGLTERRCHASQRISTFKEEDRGNGTPRCRTRRESDPTTQRG